MRARKKICSQCGKIFDRDQFKEGKDSCHECDKFKKCSKCGKELSKKYFHKDKNRKDGLTGRCKFCRSNLSMESMERLLRREENTKERQEKLLHWKEEKIKKQIEAKTKVSLVEHSKKRGKTAHKLLKKYRDKMENPNYRVICKCGNQMVHDYPIPSCLDCWFKKKSSSATGNGGYGPALASLMSKQNWKCAISGRQLIPGDNASPDHIIPVAENPKLKYDINNLQWVDIDVNFAKRALSQNDFIQLCKDVAEKTKSSECFKLSGEQVWNPHYI
jgi:hypothetical protein